MRFIKRILFIIFLLVIAFFIYRLISPSGAKSLLHDLKSFSHDKFGTDVSLTGAIITGDTMTGFVLENTGILFESGGGLQEYTGTDYSGVFIDAGTSISEPLSQTVPTPTPKPISTTPPSPTNTQQINDLNIFLENFQ